MKLINLEDTIEMMKSPDYQERFRAEVHQIGIRVEKLEKLLEKWELGELNFTPVCSEGLLKGQLAAMKLYLSILYERAEVEQIAL